METPIYMIFLLARLTGGKSQQTAVVIASSEWAARAIMAERAEVRSARLAWKDPLKTDCKYIGLTVGPCDQGVVEEDKW